MNLDKVIKIAIKEAADDSIEDNLGKLRGIYIDALAKIFTNNPDISILEYELNLRNNKKYQELKNNLLESFDEFLKGRFFE